MDKLRAMQAFVHIVDGGSLTKAAETLGASLPSMVRTLAALEAELDARLLNRTTRRIALTDEGREYYERCKRVLAEVDEAEAAISARRTTPKGRLRVTSSVMFGRLHVTSAVIAFVAKHPAVQAELVLLDRVVDLVEEGLDVGVRIGRLPDSTLVAVPVGQVRRVVCASPAYLKRAGMPKALEEIRRHSTVGFTGLSPSHEWSFGAGANAKRLAVSPAFVSNQIDAALDACANGLGLGQFLSYQVQALLIDGRLKRVLRDYEPPPVPVQVVYPGSRLIASNVRAFVDFAVPRLRNAIAG
jgi:DNA-binding transcriptional LysR family regulator